MHGGHSEYELPSPYPSSNGAHPRADAQHLSAGPSGTGRVGRGRFHDRRERRFLFCFVFFLSGAIPAGPVPRLKRCRRKRERPRISLAGERLLARAGRRRQLQDRRVRNGPHSPPGAERALRIVDQSGKEGQKRN